jgi:multidrug resistance efflux pump|tara:strand:- start:369 stop:1343 length:975 start_codon:yes stop_codon:yes gene_type:complete
MMLISLAYLGFHYKDKTKAMVAQVENQVTVISYQKPIRIKAIYVVPGQEVKKGDKLFVAESTNLEADIYQKSSELNSLNIQETGLNNHYQLEQDILKSETSFKILAMENELNELMLEKRIQDQNSVRLRSVFEGTVNTQVDSIKLARILFLEKEMVNQSRQMEVRMIQMTSRFTQDTSLIKGKIKIIKNDLLKLKGESADLIQYAEQTGNVGNLYVQLNELVPPYQSILSIYSLNPTVIKAFINERGIAGLNVGAKVQVESTNRTYRISGEIIEIGSRITSFPEKLNAINGINSYGQEIFVKISENNRFLNGEKVYVYISDGIE